MSLALMMSNRQAYDELNIPIKVKNKFINFLFSNRQIQTVTYTRTIVCFFLVFLVFLGLGIFFYVEVGKVKEVSYQYYQPMKANCNISTVCTVNFTINENMKQPIYLMYQLGNFYQNIRRYIQSKNYFQLAGHQISHFEAQSCFPYITNADMNITQSWGGTALKPDDIASPCGAVAYTYFNDTFQLYDSSNNKIAVDQTGISWDGDKGMKFRRAPDSNNTQWVDPQNEHFIVWMRTSGLPNFKKPWGKIYQDLPKGTYTMKINNNYQSAGWDGTRLFVLTTMSLIGGRNYLLPTAFILISLFGLIASLYFCFRFRALKGIGKIKQ